MTVRPFLTGLILLAALASAAHAQIPRPQAPFEELERQFTQSFGSFFGESDAERQAIEGVEISPREERRMGDAARDVYLKSLKEQRIRITERGPDVDYISSLVELIRPRMQRAKQYARIRVYVADTDEVDARAFPGGSIVVMTGLLDFAQSEAALVGVLGHELSHIDHGHQLRQLRGLGMMQEGWQQGAASPQTMSSNLRLMARNVAWPFHAEDEATADEDGARWAFELGYQPLELTDLFGRLVERSEPGAAGRDANANFNFIPSFLRSHPSYENRLSAVRELAAQLQRGSPGKELYVGRENLAQRVTRAEREFPQP